MPVRAVEDEIVAYASSTRHVLAQLCRAPPSREIACAGSDVCDPPIDVERIAAPALGPVDARVIRLAAAAAVAAALALAPSDLSAAMSFPSSMLAEVEIAHAAGGRGTLAIHRHHGYLYPAGGERLPSPVYAAAADAVRALARELGLRTT